MKIKVLDSGVVVFIGKVDAYHARPLTSGQWLLKQVDSSTKMTRTISVLPNLRDVKRFVMEMESAFVSRVSIGTEVIFGKRVIFTREGNHVYWGIQGGRDTGPFMSRETARTDATRTIQEN